MAEKANRRSENLSDVKTRFMKHLAVCCVEVDRLIRTRRRAFHQGQGHRDPRQKVGYMAAACPFRIDNCSCKPGRVIYGVTSEFRAHTENYIEIQRVPEPRVFLVPGWWHCGPSRIAAHCAVIPVWYPRTVALRVDGYQSGCLTRGAVQSTERSRNRKNPEIP